MHRAPSTVLALLAALSFLPGQDDAKTDIAKIRKEADAAVRAGNFDAAAAGFRKLTEANPKDGDAWHMLGYSLHAAGKLDEALPIHLKAAEFPGGAAAATYNVACVHALKGRVDEAFTWLDKAAERGFSDVDLLGKDTDLDALRKDARFEKLQKALAARAAAAPKIAAFAQTTERRSSRIAWFGPKGSPAQVALDYGPVPWNDEYEAAVAAGKLTGKKWRLGGDFWTTLDTSIDLSFGATTLPAGYWYLTLEQRTADSYVLACHDAAAVRKLKLDPVFANKLTGGIEIPLAHAAGDPADTLEITIRPNQGSHTEGSLRLRFGRHELSAPMTMQVE